MVVAATERTAEERAVYAAIADRLRIALPDLAAQVITAVGEEVGEYARPIEGLFGRNLTVGVHRALGAFIDLLGNPAEPSLPRAMYLELGRGELREGRDLDALLSAYRVGARVTWRAVGEHAVAAGAAPPVLVRLAEMLFTYIDGLSSLSVRGYAEEQAAQAGERDRRRTELARLLVAGMDPEALHELAVLARWTVPEAMVAVLLPAGDVPATLPRTALLWPRSDDLVALVPVAGDGGDRMLAQRLKGTSAVLGHVVAPLDLRQSLDAASALEQSDVAARGTSGPLLVDDHLVDLVLRADMGLLQRLSRRLLAPLDALSAVSRERLEVTLLAWLAHAGSRNAVARSLQVHPQTVRYRMGQLRGLFGDDLDDPECRIALQLALRAAHGPVAGEQL